ncbi:BTAD domain-containing putative transcriptional regulator [Amycolatopsis magusensis]|nr:BTAD domain-containing putative transcriptional regulator [Amycolatopsis magusensis]MDI5976944.1 BTAD domain-containing putative transcriptional regulator [Amycolatopsis magusensis]
MGGAPVSLTSARQRALLAGLALSAGRPVSIDSLARFVWGESLPARVRGSLHTYVMRLRRLIGEDTVATAPDGYRLVIEPDRVDALRFLRLLDTAVEQPDPAAERRSLGEALALWRGTPLEGVGSPALAEDWAPLLTERYLLAVERRIDLDAAAGDDPDLAAELTELIARYPLRESLWERLVVELARTGRRAEALARYAKLRELLAEELGVEPGARLRRLHLELLSAGTEAPAAPAVRDEVPRQLPFDVTRFTGRDAELAELDEFLAGQHERSTAIAVIEGAAGVGKTSLAVHWSHRVRDRFPDGQLFLDLRGHSADTPVTPDAALGRFLRAVGVAAEAIPSTVEERSAMLRSRLAGARMLMLLDNAHDADQVRPLLPGSGNLVVVTSRSQLRGLVAREGAHRLALGSLDRRGATALLAGSVGHARLAAEPDAVAELADLCGRLPLALALAGERVSRFGGMSIAGVVEELRDQRSRLDTLRDPHDAGTDLRAAFSWSYKALRPDAARLFRLLGLHPGVDISLPAAAVLGGRPVRETRDLLDQLASAHLLNQPRADRYQFHDLLRVYATERLEETESPAEQAECFGRLLDWYLCAAAEANSQVRPDLLTEDVVLPELVGPEVHFADRAAATAWYIGERSTLTALVIAATRRGWSTRTWQLSWLLRGFNAERHDIDDWIVTARHAVEVAEAAHDRIGLQYAANNLGTALLRASRTDEALAALEQGLAAAPEGGNALSVAILSNLAGAYYLREEYEESYRYSSEGVEAARRSGQQTYLAHAELNLSASCIGLGKFDDAAEHALNAQHAFLAIGDEYHSALAKGNFAEALGRVGRFDEAMEHALRALGALREMDADYGTIDVHITLGQIQRAMGEEDGARGYWSAAVETSRRLNDPRTAEVQALLDELGG